MLLETKRRRLINFDSILLLCSYFLIAEAASNNNIDYSNSVTNIQHIDPPQTNYIDYGGNPLFASQPSQNAVTSNLIQVYEHEFYDMERNAWVGGSGPNITQRWTASPTTTGKENEILPPPPQLLPPKGYNYTSEWKIDVTGTSSIRDELGWEYFIVNNSDRRRRRRWLRSVALNSYSNVAPYSNSTSSFLSIAPALFNRTFFSSSHSALWTYFKKNILKGMQDSFNFKGFGLSLYKSLLLRQACGIIFRMPLTAHFDFFETRPWLPVLTSTCGFYFPIRGSFSINASLPMALIKHALLTAFDHIKFFVMITWYAITKTIMVDIIGVIILSNLGKILGFGRDSDKGKEGTYNHEGEIIKDKAIINPNIKMFENYPSLPLKRDVHYWSSVSNRVGVSISWHCSLEKGFHFKWSWWHTVLPTIEYIGDTVNNFMKPFTVNTASSHKVAILSNTWLKEKIGSLGFIWGGFNDEPPFYFCNAAMSLSGFYYGEESLRKLYHYSRRQRLFTSTVNQKSANKSTRKSNGDRELDLESNSHLRSEEIMEVMDVKISAT